MSLPLLVLRGFTKLASAGGWRRPIECWEHAERHWRELGKTALSASDPVAAQLGPDLLRPLPRPCELIAQARTLLDEWSREQLAAVRLAR